MELHAFAFLGVKSHEEFGRMTFKDYVFRTEVYQLQREERLEELHLQAYLNQSVQETEDKKGTKPKYKTFKQFFDKQKAIDEVRSRFEDGYVPKSGNGETKQVARERMLAIQKYNARIMEERRKADVGKL